MNHRSKGVSIEAMERRTLLAVNPSVIDLLIPYTAAALQGAGGQVKLTNKINRAIADLNQTLSNSLVNATVRLIGTMQTTYTENGTGITADLAVLPTIPDIAAMKTALGADLVDLWVGPATGAPPGGAEGIADLPTNLTQGDASQGYAVQWWGDANTNLTVHEIGHLLGGGHVRGEDPTPHAIPYAYDYAATVGTAIYGTAIDDLAATSLIPYYSNPNVFFRGVPLGGADNLPAAADNANVMNQMTPLIAAYSPTMVADTVPPLAGLDQVQNTIGQNSITFDVTYYDQGGVDTTSLGNGNIQVTGPNGFSGTATLNGIIVDGNLVPVTATTLNASVVQANYTVTTPAAPGDLAGYNFAVNANQVKDVAGNFMPAGALLIASGADPNTANPQLLPRYGGNGTGMAEDLGSLPTGTTKLTDFAGPYFLKEGVSVKDSNDYRFSLTAPETVSIAITGNLAVTLFQDTTGAGVFSNANMVNPVSQGIYNLAAGTNYYLDIGPIWAANVSNTGGVFTTEISVTGAGQIVTKANLSGIVFSDINQSGNQDPGDPGVPNITATITGTDINNNPVGQTATTDTNGNYTFTNLPPANATGYTVTVTVPTGQSIGSNNPGSAGGTSQATNIINGIGLGASNATGYTFGVSPPPAPAKLSGEVFNDLNSNSALDAGEPGLSGVTVTLSGSSDAGVAVNMTATTDANGNYTFTNVPVQTQFGYTLSVGPAIGFNAEAALPGSSQYGTVSGTATANTSLGSLRVAPGNTITGLNFARTAAPATQAAPVAAAVTVVTAQNQATTGNVINASKLGTVTTTIAPAVVHTAGLFSASLIVAATRTSKKQSLMHAVLAVAPQHALSFSLNANGTFNYTPLPGFYGKDTFEYTCIMNGSGLCSKSDGPVTVIVRHVDQPPTANTEAQPLLLTSQGLPVTVDLRTFVSTDRNFSSLRFSVAKPAEGTLTLEPNGYTAIFTPNPTYFGTTSISYKASDGIKVSALMSLTVDIAPIGVNLSVPNIAIEAKHGHSPRVNVLSAVVDTVVGAKTTVAIVAQPANGTALVQNDLIIYRPAAGTSSTADSIVYTVTDNFGNSMSGTITITFAA